MHEVTSEVPQIFQYAWLIIIFPFIGVLVNLFGGKSRSEKTIGWTAVIFSGLAFAVALVVVIALGTLPEEVRLAGVNVPGYTFFAIGSMRVEFGLHIDELTAVMLMVVTLVGTLIHIYAIGYMHGDSRFQRFFIYMNLFMAMMLILVLANNYLMLFVGWEGVGLCSFLLIGFWFEKDANSNAAKKAMIANRVGDWGVLLAMFAMLVGLGTLQFAGVFEKAETGEVEQGLAVLMTLLVVGWRDRQERANSAVRVAARRDGRPDAGLRADPCGDDGHRGCVSHCPIGTAVSSRSAGAGLHRFAGRGDGGVCRFDCRGAVRY